MFLRTCGGLALAACALVSFVQAADDDRVKKLEELVKAQSAKIEALEKKQARSATDQAVDKALSGKYSTSYLASGLPEVKGTGLFVDASFLYMKAATDQQVVAFTGSGAGNAPFVSSSTPVGEQKANEFEYTPAFRVGLGYRLPYPAWDIKAEYTHFETEGHLALADKSADLTYVIEDVTRNPNAAPASATNVLSMRSTETINYDTLDFMLGHTSKYTERFDVRFQTGFTYMTYSHDLKVVSRGGSVSLAGAGHLYRNDQEFKGYGLKAGMEGNFDAGLGFGVYGAGDAVMYAGEHRSRICDQLDNLANALPPFGPADMQNFWTRTTDALIPGIQGSVGVTYKRKFGEFLNLKIKLGYEFSHYFGLNRYAAIDNSAVHLPTRDNSDVTIHGLVVNFKFDF